MKKFFLALVLFAAVFASVVWLIIFTAFHLTNLGVMQLKNPSRICGTDFLASEQVYKPNSVPTAPRLDTN